MRYYLTAVTFTSLALAFGITSQAFAQNTTCDLNINLQENGETTPGGAMHGMTKPHQIHEPQYGGSFFMAPNQSNHIEGIYSQECGLRLVIFDDMTRPISVRQFGAFVKYIPEDEDELETVRILMPSKDETMLHTSSTAEFEGKFSIELYIKFPDSDELEMFNIVNRR